MKTRIPLMLLVALICLPVGAATVVETLDVAPVWAGHRVGFCLLTHPPYQFVAYYDADRQMTVAARKLDEATWTYQQLPEQVGWDSHNYITMTVDDDDYLHLSGNLHVHPLKYFRTEKPLDITTFTRIKSMVGTEEQRTTYPRFLRGPDNVLIFTYRDGSSGKGNQIYNIYDHATQRWTRLLDKPLTDGQGKMNAYLSGPSQGPDGYWHLVWCWRNTSDCATNHSPSYARSNDLRQWEDSSGHALALPITFETGDVVDPVPPGGGVINGNVRLGFDLEQRPVVSYHKYDAEGNTQIYNARNEEGQWKVYQATQWDYRWDFSGGGSIPFEVRAGNVKKEGDALVQTWSYPKGREKWRLDPDTLQPVEKLPLPKSTTPASMRTVEHDFPGIQVMYANESGTAPVAGERYMLRWETLGPNRDRPRKKPWPEPSMLRLYRIQQ